MLPAPFQLARPTELAEAIRLAAATEDSHFHAGGTELLMAMKLRLLRPELLVDLKRIAGLDRIAWAEDASVVIGALATHRQVEQDVIVRRHLPALAALCANVANVRVRSAGTLGGNLCFAEPHADPPTLLAALGARLRLVGPDGEREVAADAFILGEFETAREPAEIMTHITVPVPRGPVAYRRFRHGERPAVNAAVAWTMAADGVTIERARIVVGALGSRPQDVGLLERLLAGRRAGEAAEAVAQGLTDAVGEIEAMDDRHGGADYKRHLAGVLITRNIAEAAAQINGATP